MRKLFYVTLIVVFMIAFTSQGLAQEKAAEHKEMMHAQHGDHAECCSMKDLGLTAKQKAKIEQMKKTFAVEQKKCQKKMAKVKGELHKLMKAEKPNKKAINKKVDELGKLGSECKKKYINHQLEFHALLTPEQLKKAKEIHGKDCCKKSHLHEAHQKQAKHAEHSSVKEHKCSGKCAMKAKKGHGAGEHGAKAACCKKSIKH